MSFKMNFDYNPDPVAESTPIKKRGRKKKSEQISNETLVSPLVPENEEETRRSGRKRISKFTITPKQSRTKRPKENNEQENGSLLENNVTEIPFIKVESMIEEEDKGGGGDEEDEEPISEEIIGINKKRKGRPGRPSRQKITNEDIPPDEHNQEFVECGKCKEWIAKSQFNQHNLHNHYFLGWIEGAPPIDMSNEPLVLSLLAKARKQGKKKFKCEKCPLEKKSAVGYLSHMSVCLKSLDERNAIKTQCNICNRLFMPSSFKIHLKNAHTVSTIQSITDDILEKSNRKAASAAKNKLQEFVAGEIENTKKKPRKNAKFNFEPLIEKVGSREMTDHLRGAWKRLVNTLGTLECKNENCTFSTENVDEMMAHFPACPNHFSDGFLCTLCKYFGKIKEAIVEHIKAAHKDYMENVLQSQDDFRVEDYEGEEDDPEDELELDLEAKFLQKKTKSTAKDVRFIAREPMVSSQSSVNYIPTVKWTIEFHIDNFKPLLFESLKVGEWFPLNAEEGDKYLPKTRKSIPLARLVMKNRITDRRKQTLFWTNFDLFEGRLENNIPTFFAGGPIWALAWCPLPSDVIVHSENQLDQYLALAAYPSMDESYEVKPCFSFPGLIQLWNIGPLTSSTAHSPPHLAYGLAHDFGLVHALAWCPSGAYQPPERLGLLAAACSDGFIHIFALPCRPETSGIILRMKPQLTLQGDAEATEAQCVSLSWYRGSGHNLIAGGFSNGLIAVWKIDSSHSLFINSAIRLPFLLFQAHSRVVNSLDFVPQAAGRFLFSTSYDLSLSFWDLENTSGPIWVQKRGFPTSGAWLTHWFSSVCTFDEGYNLCQANTLLISPRNFSFPPTPFFNHNSVCWWASYNDWLNAIANCTLAGEIIIGFPRYLVFIDHERNFRDKRFLLGYSEIIRQDGVDESFNLPPPSNKMKNKQKEKEKKNNSPTFRPITYQEMKEKNFGLLINDFPTDNFEEIPEETFRWLRNCEEMRCVTPDLYPLTSINRVAWNPNINSYQWLVEGRQCGLVRLQCISGPNTSVLINYQQKWTREFFPSSKN